MTLDFSSMSLSPFFRTMNFRYEYFTRKKVAHFHHFCDALPIFIYVSKSSFYPSIYLSIYIYNYICLRRFYLPISVALFFCFLIIFLFFVVVPLVAVVYLFFMAHNDGGIVDDGASFDWFKLSVFNEL